jgi:squalene-associated FAD-dependent desaturase
VVVGAGLAGLAAALACADGGAAVTVVERRRRLGGLTWSFEHDGRWIDNGQHVFLRCCTAYRDFLARIGSAGDVEMQDRLDVTVLRPGRAGGPPDVARLRRNDLPAPLHMGAALLRYRHLGLADRLRLGLAALPLRRVDLDDPALDAQTFGAWLSRHGQGPRAIGAMWDLICVPTVNLPAAEASAAMGAKVFQTGLLTETSAADIGWSRIPLGRLHGERAAVALAHAGADVALGERVVSIAERKDPASPGVSEGKGPAAPLEVRTEGRTLDADAVVLAVPHHAVNDVVARGTFAGQDELDGLGASPIVDVHVVYDRRVTDLTMAAGIDTPVGWLFDRTVSSGLADGHGQYLAVSMSAADAQVGRRPEDLGPEVVAALADLLPAARDARVLDTLVTKEHKATFRAVPGTAALRPGPLTRTPGVVLAGAWTDTGWPATMEGAVRSGLAAARSALVAAGSTRRLPEEVA